MTFNFVSLEESPDPGPQASSDHRPRCEPQDTPRKRALLVAMRRLRPSESGAIQARHGEDLSACQSRPGDLDLRRGDPACHRETLAARIGACNGARQRGDLLRECGIDADGDLLYGRVSPG